MGLTKKKDYEHALEVVGQEIRQWDPYGLLAMGCPADEFHNEIASVVAQIPRIAGPNDAAHAISRVFSSAFDRETFAPELCVDVGSRLYAALKKNRLLESGH
jgi:hypothetical protein